MEHQEFQLRKFGNTFLRHRDLKPGVECSLKKHFKPGTATRELAGYVEELAERNKLRFVYATPDAIARGCFVYRHGKKSGNYKPRAVEYALDLFEALGLIIYTTMFCDGAMRRGFIVLDHSQLAIRQGNRCDLQTLGSVWSQHFYPRPGLPTPPRRGGRRDSKWKQLPQGDPTVSVRLTDVAAAKTAAGAQTGAQSSAQSFSASAQSSAQTTEIQCANGCAKEGEQKVDNVNDATRDPKFGLQFGSDEPLSLWSKEPIEPMEPAGTPVSISSFDQRRQIKGNGTGKADQPACRRNQYRTPAATCGEEFEGLFSPWLSDSAFFSIASDDEFNYIALDSYSHKNELRLACAQAADTMLSARYEGRMTNARVMADAMALLKKQGIKAPGGWYPAIKRLRAPFTPE